MALKTPASLVLGLSLALAACGGGDAGDPAAVATAPATATATAPAPSAAAPDPSTAGAPQEPATTAAPATTQPPRTTATQPPPATTPPPAADPQPAPEPAFTQAQRRPARAPEPAPAPEPAGTPIEELAVLRLVERRSPREYRQEGTVTGTYDGTMALDATITNRGVVVRFVATVDGGTIVGSGITRPIVTGSPLAEIDGTMAVTGGTGRFEGIRGRRLAVTGRARLDGTYARVRLAGTVTY